MEKWNEICFLLSKNHLTDISESDFEQNIIKALRVLDWKEYKGKTLNAFISIWCSE